MLLFTFYSFFLSLSLALFIELGILRFSGRVPKNKKWYNMVVWHTPGMGRGEGGAARAVKKCFNEFVTNCVTIFVIGICSSLNLSHN